MPVRQSRRDLSQTKIEDLGVSALSHENVCRLDVAMHDALAVRGVERVSNFDGEREQRLESMGRLPIRCLSVTPSRNSMAMNACPSCSPMS